MAEEPSFLVIMDLLNAQTGRMPRSFYRAYEKLQDVQSFEVVKDGHRCDTDLTGE